MHKFNNTLARILLGVSLISLNACAATKGGAGLALKGSVLSAKGLYHSGKGAYHLGKVPINITDKALDITSGAVRLSYRVADAAGDIITVSKIVPATNISTELNSLGRLPGLIDVMIDVP